MPVNMDSVHLLLSKNRKRKADASVENARNSALYGIGTKDNKMPRSSITSPYLIPELPYVVSVCDDRIPFIALQEELNKHGIRHQVIGAPADRLMDPTSVTTEIFSSRWAMFS